MTVKKSPDQALKDYLTYLLETELVSGVLTISGERDAFRYSFISNPDGLDSAYSLFPVMPENAGTILSSLTPAKRRIAAVVHPCEMRAFVERVKREQGSLENVLLISFTCGGVYPLKTVIMSDRKKLQTAYNASLDGKTLNEDLRPTCNACDHFIPYNADITISLFGAGNSGEQTEFYLNSDTAVDVSSGFEGESADGSLDESRFDAVRKLRSDARDNLFAGVPSGDDGLKALVDTFGKCVGCHGCSHVCPICYCVLCDFESCSFDYNTSALAKDLRQKGALRLPPDTLFFQLGRLSHMSFSCVGCGQCTDVCPADIPVSTIFMKTGEQTAGLFEYVPGRDVEEDIPVMVFKEEEFTEIGE